MGEIMEESKEAVSEIEKYTGGKIEKIILFTKNLI